MLRTNAGLRLSLVVKCLIVINLSMHEDISIVGISCVHDVLKKNTWSCYFLGDSLLSAARYFRDLLKATKF